MSATEGRWIRIGDIGRDPDLPRGRVVDLLARALEDVAVAEALKMMHGEKAGFERYVKAGGVVRFDEEGEPVIWSEASAAGILSR